MPLRVELRRDAKRFGRSSGPWLRRRQISRVLGPANPASVAEVIDHKGRTVGWGLLSPVSAIAVRMLQFGPTPPREDWLEHRLEAAFDARGSYGFEAEGTTGYREVNSEGDALPGLIIDRYHDDRVVQINTAPMAAHEPRILQWLRQRGLTRLHVRLPDTAARREGLEPRAHHHDGQQTLEFYEHGLRFRVPVPGQKTGAYFDQRGNRRIVAHLAKRRGGPLLDLGCYVGGFAIHARKLGVRAVGVDRSGSALEFARDNATAAGLDDLTWVRADLFGPLEEAALEGPFGTVVLDPPRLADTPRDRDRALAALGRVVQTVAPRLDRFGHLVLCSCSHHIGREHLDLVIQRNSSEGFTRAASLGAGFDHPVWPDHIEGEYLRVNVYQRRG